METKLYNHYSLVGELLFLRWAETTSDKICQWELGKIERMTALDERLTPSQSKRVFFCWKIIDGNLDERD